MELAGVWPPFPVIITNAIGASQMPEDYDIDAAMVHPNRVREISLFHLKRSLVQRVASATRMQAQFPALTHLTLQCTDSHPPSAIPDGFLGGSAPLLQYFALYPIPFPALPKLLLSPTHLVRLTLWGIPHSGYISPEAIVTALAGMANLGCLFMGFESPLSHPHRERRLPPPPTRTVLPALTQFHFQGVSEYLEDFVSRIDAPLLDSVHITFFHQLIFDTPRLAQFMRRTTRFQELTEARVKFNSIGVYVKTLLPTVPSDEGCGRSGLGILCKELDWQLSSLAQVFTSFIPFIYMVEHLYIKDYRYQYQSQYDIENMQWLEIFHPFTALKGLSLSGESAPHIAPALQELVGGRTMQVLPMLQNILLERLEPSGPIPEGIQKFVAARQLSDRPITVSVWENLEKVDDDYW